MNSNQNILVAGAGSSGSSLREEEMDSSKDNEYLVIAPQYGYEGCGGDTSHGSTDEIRNRSCQPPQDSDSGMSNDVYQIIEHLKGRLREKDHLALRMKGVLECTDQHHKEAIDLLNAEKELHQAQLNMLRSENTSLKNAKYHCEEYYERMCASESSLEEMRQQVVYLRQENKHQKAVIIELQDYKITVQNVLHQSKAESQRANDLSSKVHLLWEENETLKTQCAELTSKIVDQDELVQNLMGEKMKAEMELKEAVSRPKLVRMDSSYTEDQMLNALDVLNIERFSQNETLLQQSNTQDELNLASKDDCDRLSLLDELRLSTNVSEIVQYTLDCSKCVNKTIEHVATQTEDSVSVIVQYTLDCSKCVNKTIEHVATQTEDSVSVIVQYTLDCSKCVNKTIEHVSTQTEDILDNKHKDSPNTNRSNTEDLKTNNNQDENCKQCNTGEEYDEKNVEIFRLEKLVTDLKCDLTKYQENQELLFNLRHGDLEKYTKLQTERDYLNAKLCEFETTYCNQTETNNSSKTCGNLFVLVSIFDGCGVGYNNINWDIGMYDGFSLLGSGM